MDILGDIVIAILMLFSLAMLWSLCEVASRADEWEEQKREKK